MITVLSGGTGTPKLLQGLVEVTDPEDITVIVNTAEDMWLPHGYFSPDIDTVMYTLSGQINEETWYGIRGDTFETHKRLLEDGKEILNIGDRDRETHIRRGELMKEGNTLTESVDIQRKEFGISAEILPMTDDEVQTVIVTPSGEMDLHEYLIEHRDEEVNDIYFKGIESARATEEVAKAMRHAQRIIIGPSNPISSILPITSLNGIKIDRIKCIAVSPIVGGKPVSGPADKFMQAKGYAPDSQGVTEIYKGLIRMLVVDELEKDFDVEGVQIIKASTIMRSMDDKKALADFLLVM
ncbi:MAG: 2-phospho-L-lactate transferase [Candidatus Hydrothermarchaeaceae archaeon]